MKKTITFSYFMNLQARFIRFSSFLTHKREIELAVEYAPKLRSKIERKYILNMCGSIK